MGFITFAMTGVIIPFTAMADFPNRINELRRARRWSQQKLADIVGCSKMQISGLERGQPELTVNWMRRIASALGVAPADLLNPEDNPERLDDRERYLVRSYRYADAATRENLGRVAEALTGYRPEPPAEDVNDSRRSG